MNRFCFRLPSLVSSVLVFGSLGFSGFVGAVATMADEGGAASDLPHLKIVFRQNQINAFVPGRNELNRENFDSTVANINPTIDEVAYTTSIGHGVTPQLLGVRLSKDGDLTGRLAVADSNSGSRVIAEHLTIKFVQRGSIITEVKPGAGGIFHASQLSPGIVSMIASGSDGLYATSVVLFPNQSKADQNQADSLPVPLQIDATVVHPANIEIVKKLIRGRSDSTASTPKQQKILNASRRSGEPSISPTTLQTPILNVSPEGIVKARVNSVDQSTGERIPAVGATIYLIQRGTIRSRSVVNEEGSFSARGLAAGNYTVLAVSENGRPEFGPGGRSFAAVGVMLESDGSNAASGVVGSNSRRPVLTVKDAKRQDGGSFSIDMMPTADYEATLDPGPDNQQQAAGTGLFGNGTGSGGAGGGSGGGFGGGGLGLLGLGAGAAGLAVALSNQKNNNNNPSSPSK